VIQRVTPQRARQRSRPGGRDRRGRAGRGSSGSRRPAGRRLRRTSPGSPASSTALADTPSQQCLRPGRFPVGHIPGPVPVDERDQGHPGTAPVCATTVVAVVPAVVAAGHGHVARGLFRVPEDRQPAPHMTILNRDAHLVSVGVGDPGVNDLCQFQRAERVGFEPTDPGGSAVFKTAAFVHSATAPMLP
jgi:hypothetical protein